MYAHALIGDLQKYLASYRLVSPPSPFKEVDRLPDYVENAQKFHLGSVAGYQEMGMPILGTLLFQGVNGDVRLPYKQCYFDWHRFDVENKGNGDYPTTPSLKRAVLCQEFDANTFLYFIFNHFNEAKAKSKGVIFTEYDIWQVSPVAGVALIDSSLGTNLMARELLYTMLKHQSDFSEARIDRFIGERFDANVFPLPLSPEIIKDRHTLWRFHNENVEELIVLNMALKLLSCKNVGTKVNQPPARLNKKRMKKNKPPIFSYRTLTIKTGTGGNSTTDPKGLWENPVHLCRGHFKTYTEERPLFGRVVGRYWWQPQVRGHKKQGVVIKDYQIA